jgi:hypothetical protein
LNLFNFLIIPRLSPRVAPQQYCAPRLQDGYELDAACRRIAVRAELLPPADLCGDVAPRRLQAAV